MPTPFVSTFTHVGDSADFSTEAWHASFFPDAIAAWEHDLGGPLSDGRHSLIIEYVGDGCVSIAYDNRSHSFHAAGNSDDDGLIVTDTGATVPARSQISLADAWPIVAAFLADPTTRPDGAWIDADEVEWARLFES